jgi:hypothetical protein
MISRGLADLGEGHNHHRKSSGLAGRGVETGRAGGSGDTQTAAVAGNPGAPRLCGRSAEDFWGANPTVWRPNWRGARPTRLVLLSASSERMAGDAL